MVNESYAQVEWKANQGSNKVRRTHLPVATTYKHILADWTRHANLVMIALAACVCALVLLCALAIGM